MDELLRLETPEQIEINYDLARLGSRFIATLWDTLFITILWLLLAISAGVLTQALGSAGLYILADWVEATGILLAFFLFWGYYVIFEIIWNGQTPGKRLASIRTVRQDGYPIGFRESAIRNMVRVVDLLPMAYALGVLVMFIDLRSRRLGDFAAGTIVVHERGALELKALRSTMITEDPRYLEPSLPFLERLHPDEVQAARRFLQRYPTLANGQALAALLANRFRERLGLEPGQVPDDQQLLKLIVAQYGREEQRESYAL